MTTGAFRARPFAPGDLPEIEALWVAAWSATGFDIDFEARRPWLREHLAALDSRGVRILVGLDASGSPRGFVTLDVETGYLDQLCVARALQGAGMARMLLDEAKRLAPGRAELKVNADNSRARRFYEREGFVVTGHDESPLSGLPVLRMTWRHDAS